MYLEAYDDGNHLIVDNQTEEFTCETLYMVGMGVSCKKTARGETTREYYRMDGHPYSFSASVTEAIFRGAYKVIDDEEKGVKSYFGMTPDGARKIVRQLTELDVGGIDSVEQFLAETG